MEVTSKVPKYHPGFWGGIFDNFEERIERLEQLQWELLKMGAKCHFATLNSILAPLNSVLAPMVGVKMGCHFNNSIFLIKKYN